MAAGGDYQGDGTICETVECPGSLLGDMSGDGVLNGEDIQPFIEVLLY